MTAEQHYKDNKYDEKEKQESVSVPRRVRILHLAYLA